MGPESFAASTASSVGASATPSPSSSTVFSAEEYAMKSKRPSTNSLSPIADTT